MPLIQQSRSIGSPDTAVVLVTGFHFNGSRMTVTRSPSSRPRTSAHRSNVAPGSFDGVRVIEENVVIGVLYRSTTHCAYCCACVAVWRGNEIGNDRTFHADAIDAASCA